MERQHFIPRHLPSRRLLLCALLIWCDQSQLHILLERPRVRAHVPLGVAHASEELDKAVPRGIVELQRERCDRLLARSLVLFFVFVWVAEHPTHLGKEGFDFGVRVFVLNAAEGLVEGKVADDVAQETFDGGELPALRWWESELEIGDSDFAVGRADDLAVEILAVTDFQSVFRSLL